MTSGDDIHPDLDAALIAYAGGAFGEQDRARLEARLAADPALARRVERLRAEQEGLAAGLGARHAPSGLDELRRARIREAAAAAASRRPRHPHHRARGVAILAAAALVLAVAGIGIGSPHFLRAPRAGDRMAEPASAADVRPPPVADDETAGVANGLVDAEVVQPQVTVLDVPVEEIETEDMVVTRRGLAADRSDEDALADAGGSEPRHPAWWFGGYWREGDDDPSAPAASSARGTWTRSADQGRVRFETVPGADGLATAGAVEPVADAAGRGRAADLASDDSYPEIYAQITERDQSRETIAATDERSRRSEEEAVSEGIQALYGRHLDALAQERAAGDDEAAARLRSPMAELEWRIARMQEATEPRVSEQAEEATSEPGAAETAVEIEVESDVAVSERRSPSRPRPAPPVNPWTLTAADAESTFALDVDTASYAIAARAIRAGVLPPPRTVRMEDFVNALDHGYPTRGEHTFAVHAAAMPAPFAEAGTTLLRIGVKARVLGRDRQRPAHLVFCVDRSGSMDQDDRLPLVRRALAALLDDLADRDRVSIVAYGGEPHLVLAGAEVGAQRDEILAAIAGIRSTGGTHLAGGLELAYRTAAERFRADAENRVVLCSDGVANIGATDGAALRERVAAWRDQGIALTCVGFGAGAYNDALLEELATHGDGSYLFVDSVAAIERRFQPELAAALRTVAEDAKIQVAFDPDRVRRYRLIGYENRDITDRDFRNDAVDAGEVGSGQAATALYELELVPTAAGEPRDLGEVRLRWHDVADGAVAEIAYRLPGTLPRPTSVEEAPRLWLAACAAEFAEILRDSEHAADGDLSRVAALLERVTRALPFDDRAAELHALVRRSIGLPRSR